MGDVRRDCCNSPSANSKTGMQQFGKLTFVVNMNHAKVWLSHHHVSSSPIHRGQKYLCLYVAGLCLKPRKLLGKNT